MGRAWFFVLVSLILGVSGSALSQGAIRRVTTVAAIREFPGYYHLQNVLVHGEFVENGSQVVLRGGDRDLPVLWNDRRATSGLVEVRGTVLDVGRLEPGDPRLARYDTGRDPERWPRPGEELVLSVASIAETQLATTPTVRALALQPWRFDGQKVTVTGQFRGRNLYGDSPTAPGTSRYDFVLRSADAAVWITGLRPRGKGFDLSVDARVDTSQWLQVSGVVSIDRGLVAIAGNAVTSTAPEAAPPAEEVARPDIPLESAEVVFSSPIDGDSFISPTGTVRIQFSRGLDPVSIDGRLRATYVGAAATGSSAPIELSYAYDAGPRAIEITFGSSLEPFRTIRVEVLEGIKAFDGGPVTPWALSFSTGN